LSESKKKIIIVGPSYPYRGGNSLFVTYLYNSLKDNFDVKIYNYKLLYPSILFPGKTQFDESKLVVFKAPNERIVNSINPFNWISTASKINKEKADLVVFDWWHPFFSFCHFTISFLIKKKYKNKILFITENVVSHESHFIDRILTKIGLSNSSMFLALSGIVEKELENFAKGKPVFRSELPIYECYSVTKNFDQDKFKKELGIKSENNVLLFFGYVRKYKGLDLLIKAMPEIIRQKPNTTLLIVGEFYDDPKPYLDLINSLSLVDKIKVVNKFVANEDVEKYYVISDLVVLPYRSATQSGILNVAYGFNKPVLVTEVGGLAEFVEESETGYIVEPENPEKISEGIIKFLKEKDSINFEKNIKNSIQQNTFSNVVQVFEQILSTN
jgi:glycosyltransferase involved in cell wall biosynthesis